MSAPWTPLREQTLQQLAESGLSASQIADVLGCSRGAVLGKLHRLRLGTQPAWWRAARLMRHRDGAKLKAIAACFGVDESTVSIALRPDAVRRRRLAAAARRDAHGQA
jgi:hypothetical protein